MITLSSQSGDALRRHLARRAFVEDDLRSGRLVAPLALRVHTASRYFLAYPRARRDSPQIRAFEQWIVEETANMEEAIPQPQPPPQASAGRRGRASIGGGALGKRVAR
jgi:hypothetical protein